MIVKMIALDTPPPGALSKTVMLAVPGSSISVFGISAVRVPPSMNVVARFAPFQRTTDWAVKF